MRVLSLLAGVACTAIVCSVSVHAETNKQGSSAPGAPSIETKPTIDKTSRAGAKVAAVSEAETPAVSGSAASGKTNVQPKAKAKPAAPRLTASINLSNQTMTVLVGGKTHHVWKISSGRGSYRTPTGTYRPQWLARMHYSKKYDNAPMPHSVFFHKGYAIHATYATGRLGSPASHGCIRLSPSNAKKFYRLVQKYGKSSTRISIRGVTPPSRTYAKRKKRIKRRATYSPSYAWGTYYAPTPKKRKKKVYRKPYKKPAKKYSYGYGSSPYTWPGD